MTKRKKANATDSVRGHASDPEMNATRPTEPPPGDPAPNTMQLIQEHLDVSKQWVEAGAVVITKTVETVPMTVPVELTHEEIELQRLPVERLLADGEAALPRQEGDTLIIPVVEEELVVVKRRVVREEWRLTKRRVAQRREVQDTVRREHLQFDTTGGVEFISDEGVPDAGTTPGL